MVSKVRTFKSEKGLSQDVGTYRRGELRGVIRINEEVCVGCDTCRGVCPADAIEGSVGEKHKINLDKCVVCGQCLINCPFDAVEQMSFVEDVLPKLKDKQTKVVAIVAPAVRVAIAEEFGARPGTLALEKLWVALKKAGFEIYDNNFAADQTILEEGTELLARIAAHAGLKELPVYLWGKKRVLEVEEYKHKPLPQFTSCCPAWVRYVELYYPDLIPYLSTCKSPQQMAGADRFLLKHETIDKTLFRWLKPDTNLTKRVRCLNWLKELGYEVGTGCIVGLPGQRIETLVEDLLFFTRN